MAKPPRLHYSICEIGQGRVELLELAHKIPDSSFTRRDMRDYMLLAYCAQPRETADPLAPLVDGYSEEFQREGHATRPDAAYRCTVVAGDGRPR